MWNWFEDDILWESLESFLFSQFRSSATTVREAEQILSLVHPPPGAPCSICAADRAATPWSLRAVVSRSRVWTAPHATWKPRGPRRHARD